MCQKVVCLIAFIILLQSASTQASSAPPALFGKSVAMSWSEDRKQRDLGDQTVRQYRAYFQVGIYISGAGRLFIRFSATAGVLGRDAGGHGGAASRRSGASDQVVGEDPRAGAVHFAGHTLLVQKEFRGGARQIRIDFDEGFQSCTASVLTGKASGANVIQLRSLNTGRPIEVSSVTTGAATCSLKAGNVFAE